MCMILEECILDRYRCLNQLCACLFMYEGVDLKARDGHCSGREKVVAIPHVDLVMVGGDGLVFKDVGLDGSWQP